MKIYERRKCRCHGGGAKRRQTCVMPERLNSVVQAVVNIVVAERLIFGH